MSISVSKRREGKSFHMDRMNAILIVCVFVTMCDVSVGVKFPSDITRCKVADTECIVQTSNQVLNMFYKGHNGINLLPLDPLSVPRISIIQGGESPVNVELIFTNNSVIGLKNFKFYKITGFQEKPEGKYEFRFKGPRLELVGPYSINGRILILPIQGVGDSNITMINPDMLVRFTGKSEMRNGKEYLRPEKTKLSFTMTQLVFNLGNLYNGDKALGDNTNLFLNENWKEVFPEIKGSVFEAFAQIIENVMKNVFAKLPYKELFIE